MLENVKIEEFVNILYGLSCFKWACIQRKPNDLEIVTDDRPSGHVFTALALC